MAVFIERVDSLPVLSNSEFPFEFISWLAVLIDTLNEAITTIQDELNQTVAPSFTTAEITALALTAPNGTLWYDTTTNQLKAKVNGVVVVIV